MDSSSRADLTSHGRHVDIVAEFHSEKAVQTPAIMKAIRSLTGVRAVILALSIIAVAQAVFLVRGVRFGAVAAVAPATGSVVVQSTPAGASVFVNGQERGKTPLTLSLESGSYTVRVAQGAMVRELPVSVARGSAITQHVVFGDTNKSLALGGLQISTQPAGVRVTVDGAAVGVTPLKVSDLAPGQHVVALEGPSGTSRQNVMVEAGTISSLSVAMPAAVGASGGWITVASPIALQLYENGALIGSTETRRIMLPAGKHVITVANTALGFERAETVQVSPGGVASLQITPPTAALNINATPWADVTVAGRMLGTTPLGNVALPIGNHEVVFRHPQFGERRVNATVTLSGPNRVSVNMNQR